MAYRQKKAALFSRKGQEGRGSLYRQQPQALPHHFQQLFFAYYRQLAEQSPFIYRRHGIPAVFQAKRQWLTLSLPVNLVVKKMKNQAYFEILFNFNLIRGW